jgi:hypothetical protein
VTTSRRVRRSDASSPCPSECCSRRRSRSHPPCPGRSPAAVAPADERVREGLPAVRRAFWDEGVYAIRQQGPRARGGTPGTT